MLKLIITGRVGKDAVIRRTTGKSVVSFPIANNERYTSKDGTKHEKTTWIDCALWQHDETKIASYITKGQWLYLEGNPTASAYLKEDEIIATLKLNVTKIEFVGDKKAEDPTANW
ncbi:single-stranded DNA-binding protein [Lewinella sp. LCG006]|uniref:single-stranded DNA-binding protein n=1 Tax=Lewinella sp. LCG006 TaxID=3231911 RepID=UPI00345F707F